MILDQQDAIALEYILRKLYNCERGGFGGFINSDHFARKPVDAALIALAHIYKGKKDEDIGDFLSKWEAFFDYPEDNSEFNVEMYINELSKIVETLK